MIKPIDTTCPHCGATHEYWVEDKQPVICPRCNAEVPQDRRLYAFPKHGTWLPIVRRPLPPGRVS